ncbi:MAG: peptidylprolyl isomerase [Fimbriimonadaceae bacterium]
METKFGRIILRFFEDKAPNHVKNFKDLAKKGFYDGTTFHRVIPGFMIQGGDPNSKNADRADDGQGGPGYSVNAEFSEISHVRGVLSMARSTDPNSAGSQFFICVANSFSLDTQYTAFGRVVFDGTEKEGAEEPAGLAVADKIVNQPRDKSDNPNQKIEMKVKIMTWPLK